MPNSTTVNYDKPFQNARLTAIQGLAFWDHKGTFLHLFSSMFSHISCFKSPSLVIIQLQLRYTYQDSNQDTKCYALQFCESRGKGSSYALHSWLSEQLTVKVWLQSGHLTRNSQLCGSNTAMWKVHNEQSKKSFQNSSESSIFNILCKKYCYCLATRFCMLKYGCAEVKLIREPLKRRINYCIYFHSFL